MTNVVELPTRARAARIDADSQAAHDHGPFDGGATILQLHGERDFCFRAFDLTHEEAMHLLRAWQNLRAS